MEQNDVNNDWIDIKDYKVNKNTQDKFNELPINEQSDDDKIEEIINSQTVKKEIIQPIIIKIPINSLIISYTSIIIATIIALVVTIKKINLKYLLVIQC